MTTARPAGDAGLQPERTRLAWSRTALAFLANGVLMMHAGHRFDHWAWQIPGASIVATAVLVHALGARRRAQVEHALSTGGPSVGMLPVALTAGAAVSVSLLGVVVIASGF